MQKKTERMIESRVAQNFLIKAYSIANLMKAYFIACRVLKRAAVYLRSCMACFALGLFGLFFLYGVGHAKTKKVFLDAEDFAKSRFVNSFVDESLGLVPQPELQELGEMAGADLLWDGSAFNGFVWGAGADGKIYALPENLSEQEIQNTAGGSGQSEGFNFETSAEQITTFSVIGKRAKPANKKKRYNNERYVAASLVSKASGRDLFSMFRLSHKSGAKNKVTKDEFSLEPVVFKNPEILEQASFSWAMSYHRTWDALLIALSDIPSKQSKDASAGSSEEKPVKKSNDENSDKSSVVIYHPGSQSLQKLIGFSEENVVNLHLDEISNTLYVVASQRSGLRSRLYAIDLMKNKAGLALGSQPQMLYEASEITALESDAGENGLVYLASLDSMQGQAETREVTRERGNPEEAAYATSFENSIASMFIQNQVAELPESNLESKAGYVSKLLSINRKGQGKGQVRLLHEIPNKTVLALHYDEQEENLYLAFQEHAEVWRMQSSSLQTELLSFQAEELFSVFIENEDETGFFGIKTKGAGVVRLQKTGATHAAFYSASLDFNETMRFGAMIYDFPEALSPLLKLEIFTQSGNTKEADSENWSALEALKEGKIMSPAARFLRVEILISPNSKNSRGALEQDRKRQRSRRQEKNRGARPWRLSGLGLYVAAYNRAPELGRPYLLIEKEKQQNNFSKKQVGKVYPQLQNKLAKSLITKLMWDARDVDGDALFFSVEVQRQSEAGASEKNAGRPSFSRWQSLADDLREPFFALLPQSFPSGWYRFRVTANDGLENEEAENFSVQAVSRPLLFDHEPPGFGEFSASIDAKESSACMLSFVFEDEYSPLRSLFYDSRGTGFKLLSPLDGLFDSKREQFQLLSPNMLVIEGKADYLLDPLLLLAEDEAGNLRLHSLSQKALLAACGS